MDSPSFNSFTFEQNEEYNSPLSLPPTRTSQDDVQPVTTYCPSTTVETPIQSVSSHQPTAIIPSTPLTIDSIYPQPKIQNIVSTVNLGCQLKLKEIAKCVGNAEYNPKRFSAIIMRIRSPGATLLIFQSGKLVCTGTKSVEDSNRAARRGARIIQKVGYPAKFMNFQIQNMVGSVDVKFPIRISTLDMVHKPYSKFEPEVFPGLIYRIEKPKIVLLIFDSGKVILTGAKVIEDIYTAFDLIYPVLKRFRRSSS